jgi:hypothetical protein
LHGCEVPEVQRAIRIGSFFFENVDAFFARPKIMVVDVAILERQNPREITDELN